jgi:hypothetical protein
MLTICSTIRIPARPSEFISPASARASFKRIQGQKYKQRKNVQSERDDRRTRQRDELEEDELAVGRVFA